MIRTAVIIIALLTQSSYISYAEDSSKIISIENIRLLKISATDQRAVIKTPDGNMTIIKVGDVIGSKSVVVEIADSRVVCEQQTAAGPETVIMRLMNGKRTVERVTKTVPLQPSVPARQMSTNAR